VLIAALIAVFAVAGIVTAMVINGSQGGRPAEGGTPSSRARPPSAGSSAPVAQPSLQGPINWSQAGQLVIDYYNGTRDPQTTWAMLSTNLHTAFGGLPAFQQYWSQYKEVSARNARGVTTNPDGSVNVPVDVTYTGQDGAARQDHKTLKVIIENGRLAIDSDGH
jgi:hypothetical protein